MFKIKIRTYPLRLVNAEYLRLINLRKHAFKWQLYIDAFQ